MSELIKGSDEQVVEFATLQKIKFGLLDIQDKSSTAKEYLILVEKALSYYDIQTDDRYWHLMTSEELSQEQKNLNDKLISYVLDLDSFINRRLRHVLIGFWTLVVIAIAFPQEVGLYGLFFPLSILLSIYAYFSLTSLIERKQFLSKVLIMIVENSKFTYGKRVKE